MRVVRLPETGVAEAWRAAARDLASRGVPGEAVEWVRGDAPASLFEADEAKAGGPVRAPKVPRGFVELARKVAHHSDPERFARLYDLLLRLQERPRLLEDVADPGVARITAMRKSVRRDMHKMTAFVRFREVEAAGGRRRFVAWFEPEHPITEITAPFFARRFGDMDWMIATPHLCARFEDGALDFLPGVEKPAGGGDPTEELWRTYYRNIFNPARLKVAAMRSEMPKKYWKNLPEATLIPELIAGAEGRVREMREREATLPPVRTARMRKRAEAVGSVATGGTIAALRAEAAGCARCPLHAHATRVVFGEGPAGAALMFVGEQPGDREDLEGRPFTGPAGQVFDETLRAAGIARDEVYVTNAVKHFKHVVRGKRRIHQRPDAGEVSHCRWWLDAERTLVRPKLIVALGATAALALTGDGSGILRRRGTVERPEGSAPVFLTVHPSFLLRLPDTEARARETAAFRADLEAAAEFVAA
jgi:DNA polymerase